MAKLLLLRGLPCSGKTTHSIKYVQIGYKRISLDDLRNMIDNGAYSKSNEKYIQDLAQTAIALALQSDFNVIYDATNLNPYHIKFAKSICRDTRSELQIVDLNTPLSICLQRDLERSHGRVGRDVIMKMYNRYFINGEFPKVEE
jgi:predicted kinase